MSSTYTTTAPINGRYGYRASDGNWYIIGQGADGAAYPTRAAVLAALVALPRPYTTSPAAY